MHVGGIIGCVGNEAKWKVFLHLNLSKVLLASTFQHQKIERLLGIMHYFKLIKTLQIPA